VGFKETQWSLDEGSVLRRTREGERERKMGSRARFLDGWVICSVDGTKELGTVEDRNLGVAAFTLRSNTRS